MKLDELKPKAIQEIENILWKLGDGDSSDIFPDFNMDGCDLDYGLQREGEAVVIETKYLTKDKRRIFVRVNVSLEVE